MRVAKEWRKGKREHKGDEEDPTELINLEIITNPAVKGDVFLYFSASQSQRQGVAVVSSSSHGKSHMGHLSSLVSLKLEISLIHFPYQSSSNLT